VAERVHVVATGEYRSGTTFLARLMDNLSDGYCASQPFPYLYLDAKRRFLVEMGLAVPTYPIGTGFHDPLHLPDEMAAYLGSETIDRSMIDETFSSMQSYSGATVPELADVVGRIPEGTLGEVTRGMHELLAEKLRPNATVLGSKELILEEFIPTFANAGVKVVLALRDPRNVVASTIGPNSKSWTGNARPLLHSIRLWRKTVAYVLGYRETVALAQFESLIAEPESTLVASLRHLGVETEGRLQEPWLDPKGRPWQPNTSFPEGGEARPRFSLTDRQLAYVEALAGPEMRALGYDTVGADMSLDDALDGFRAEDDPGRNHPVFSPDFSVDPAQLTLERERLRLLHSPEPLPDESRWFVLPQVRERLAAASSR